MLWPREKISLTDLKIEKTRLRRAVNGGYLIEITDSGCVDKAKALEEKVRTILPMDKVVVARPVRTGELRFMGLDDTITSEEVADFIIDAGKCNEGKVKVGAIQAVKNGLYTAWARCPLAVAAVIARRKKVPIGRL